MRERERKAKLKKREVFAIREDITIIFSYSFSYLQQHFPCFYIHLLLPRRPQTQNFSFYIVVIVVVANTSLLQQLFLSIVFVCDGEKQVSFLEKVLREKKKNERDTNYRKSGRFRTLHNFNRIENARHHGGVQHPHSPPV